MLTRRQVLISGALTAGVLMTGGCAARNRTAVRFPKPLTSGGTIGVCAPSAGVPKADEARYTFAINYLKELGYSVETRGTIITDDIVSGPAKQRAADLQELLLDPEIDAVLPPWGGELLIDILPFIDWGALRAAAPTWLIGYSDLSTFQVPYLIRTGTASIDGSNLLETPMRPPGPGLAWWPDVASLSSGQSFTQESTPRYQASDVDWSATPNATSFNLDTASTWKVLGHEDDSSFVLSVRGRIVAGTIDVLAPIACTPDGDLPGFADSVRPDKLLIALDAADFNSAQLARALWDLRAAGWFDAAAAVVLGRTAGEVVSGYTVRDAADDVLGDLDLPVVYDADVGHLPPQMAWVQGALATLQVSGGQGLLTQTLA
jgi:muramoyltetrapeptide carboxypeptidase